MAAKDDTGRWGEQLGAGYLALAGWQVVERNWRCRAGEVDIVARRGALVVFLEVKTRTGTGFGDPAEAVTAEKVVRIRKVAGQWLAAHPDPARRDVRFDVLAVLRPPGGRASLRHIRAAF